MDFILSKIEELVVRSELDITFSLKRIGAGLTADYNPITKHLNVDPWELMQTVRHEELLVEEYIELVVAHELGHASDVTLNQGDLFDRIICLRIKLYEQLDEFERMIQLRRKNEELISRIIGIVENLKVIELPAEERACELGKKFVSVNLLDKYLQHCKSTLSAYCDNYEEILEEAKSYLLS